jgi:hypothetical protein
MTSFFFLLDQKTELSNKNKDEFFLDDKKTPFLGLVETKSLPYVQFI